MKSLLIMNNNSRNYDSLKSIYNIIDIYNAENYEIPEISLDGYRKILYDINTPQSLFKLNQYFIYNLKKFCHIDILLSGGLEQVLIPQYYVNKNSDRGNIYYYEDNLNFREIISDKDFDGSQHRFELTNFIPNEVIYKIL